MPSPSQAVNGYFNSHEIIFLIPVASPSPLPNVIVFVCVVSLTMLQTISAQDFW
jgi:hypothetical protein